jgi:hypothetical protein
MMACVAGEGRHAERYILAAPDSAFLDPQQAALDHAARGRSDFRDAACHIIRADETAFSRPILALEERDGELC